MYAAIGIILIGLGIFSGHWLERKAFYRRNSAGIEGYENYGALVKTRAAEGVVKFFGGLALLAGIGCVAAAIVF